MPVSLRTNPQIDKYIAKVVKEAQHHAQNVKDVVQPLSDEVRTRLTLGVDTVEVYSRAGNIGRSCWVTLGGKRYAFSYNYKSGEIEMRKDNLQGEVLATFDNGSSSRQIARDVARM